MAGISNEKERKLITLSVPVYNEEKNIDRLCKELAALASCEPDYDFEFLFTDNASDDKTFEMLADRANSDPRIRVLRFSRNFGFQKSILTNYLNARGAAAVQLDADLQDPPMLVREFLRSWEEGYKVVYGIRRHRKENFLVNAGRKLFYSLISSMSTFHVPKDAGDFRLIDRTIIDHLRTVDEQTPYLRGIISSLGYRQTGVVYDRERRIAGRSKFGLMSLVDLSIDGLTAQSTKPLRFVTIFGLMVSALSLMLIFYYFILFLFDTDNLPSGFTTIVLLLVFLIGLNSFILGLLGEYVGRVFNNTRGLPMTIIMDRIDHGQDQSSESAAKLDTADQ